MRPQEIEKIAQGVAGAFAQAGQSSVKAGCGAFGNPEACECVNFGCSANYECGEMGNFTCMEGSFFCQEGFFCASNYTG